MHNTLHEIAARNAVASTLAVGMLLTSVGISQSIEASDTAAQRTVLAYQADTQHLRLVQGPAFSSAPLPSYAAGVQMVVGLLLIAVGLLIHALRIVRRAR